MKIGKYEITESYANEPDKIGIYQHETGEGGDFNRAAFEELIAEFYKENF